MRVLNVSHTVNKGHLVSVLQKCVSELAMRSQEGFPVIGSLGDRHAVPGYARSTRGGEILEQFGRRCPTSPKRR